MLIKIHAVEFPNYHYPFDFLCSNLMNTEFDWKCPQRHAAVQSRIMTILYASWCLYWWFIAELLSNYLLLFVEWRRGSCTGVTSISPRSTKGKVPQSTTDITGRGRSGTSTGPGRIREGRTKQKTTTTGVKIAQKETCKSKIDLFPVENCHYYLVMNLLLFLLKMPSINTLFGTPLTGLFSDNN